MWSSRPDRRLFLTGLLALPACGFTPVYGPENRANALFGKVAWQAPTTSSEFDLVEQLRHRLGRSDAPEWQLSYVYSAEPERFGGAEASRGRIHGTLTYQLAPVDGSSPGFTGELTAFAGFTIAETTPTDTAPIISNRVARRDAERRLAIQLADRLVSELMMRVGQQA